MIELLFAKVVWPVLSGALGSMGIEVASQAVQKRYRAIQETNAAMTIALKDIRPIHERIELLAVRVAGSIHLLAPSATESPIFRLLTREDFQKSLANWLEAAWDLDGQQECLAAMSRIIVNEFRSSLDEPAQERLRTDCCQAVEQTLLSDPALAHWRIELAMGVMLEHLKTISGGVGKIEGRDKSIKEQIDGIELRFDGLTKMLHSLEQDLVQSYSTRLQKEVIEEFCRISLQCYDSMNLVRAGSSSLEHVSRPIRLLDLFVPLGFVPYTRFATSDGALTVTKNKEGERSEPRGLDDGGSTQALKSLIVEKDTRKPDAIGKYLKKHRRLVVLGEAGAGKSALVSWMAVCYLTRRKSKKTFAHLNGTRSLPDDSLLPVVVRCRDFERVGVPLAVDDAIELSARATGIASDKIDVFLAVVREAMANGKALILIDGLDEIFNAVEQIRFCEMVELFARQYPKTYLVLTMRATSFPGNGLNLSFHSGAFFSGTLDGFSYKQKRYFVKRWCEFAERPKYRKQAEQKLIGALGSSRMATALTANPLLMTVFALVVSKHDSLPLRECDLFDQAIKVLLSLRSDYGQAIDVHEAYVQLEYLAYEMCASGAIQITEDKAVQSIMRMRSDFPHITRAKKHTPAEFLKLMRERSGILVQVGVMAEKGLESQLLEFLHPAFQSYLAGRALAWDRYPVTILEVHSADQEPSAGRPKIDVYKSILETPERWYDVLRTAAALAMFPDSETLVGEVLAAASEPCAPGRGLSLVALAADCLAQEAEIGNEKAQHVLGAFAGLVNNFDVAGRLTAELERTFEALCASSHLKDFVDALAIHFIASSPEVRVAAGILCGRAVSILQDTLGGADSPADENRTASRQTQVVGAEITEIKWVLRTLYLARLGKLSPSQEVVNRLFGLMTHSDAVVDAASWSLYALSSSHLLDTDRVDLNTGQMLQLLDMVPASLDNSLRSVCLVGTIGHSRRPEALEGLRQLLDRAPFETGRAVISAMEDIGTQKGAETLGQVIGEVRGMLRDDAYSSFRSCCDQIDRQLLSRNLDGQHPWLPLNARITDARAVRAANRLNIPEEDVRRRLQMLSELLCGRLRIEFTSGP